MEQMALFFDRRSIRRFSHQRVENEIIEQVLKAAMYAPSAVNRQPWHFIVTADRAIMDRIIEIHPHAGMLRSASHAVIICGDEELQHDDGYWIVDCGAATQNMLLAAHTLGLGACWVGLHPREARKAAVSELMGLPGHVKPFALVAMGYPAERKPRPDRFHREKVKRDHWSNPYYNS